MRNYRGLTKEGKWVYGDKVEIGKSCWIVSRPELTESDDMTEVHCSIWGFIEVIPETVGQQVGIPDKTGTKIYEGDIVVKNNGIYVIRCSMHSFDLASNTTDWSKREDGYSYYGCSWDDIKVIGNIHENPELLI